MHQTRQIRQTRQLRFFTLIPRHRAKNCLLLNPLPPLYAPEHTEWPLSAAAQGAGVGAGASAWEGAGTEAEAGAAVLSLIAVSPVLPVPVVAADPTIQLSKVWQHLSPQQQAHLRQTLLQTLQEVISRANCNRNDCNGPDCD